MKQTSLPLFLSALLLTGLLAGCSSGEERQAKYYARAQALFAEGDYDKAKLEVRNVLQINAEHPQARYLWAQLAEREQNWREMFGNLQMAVDLDPNYIDARIKLGQLYYRSQAYDQALAQLPDADRKAQRPGLIMAAIYRTLLDEIARDGFQVLTQRTSLTPIRKLWIATRTWAKG